MNPMVDAPGPPSHFLAGLPQPEWPLAQTGLTPYLLVDEDSKGQHAMGAEANVFDKSFGGNAENTTTSLANTHNQCSTAKKHDLSPGAATSIVQSHLKRPKLPNPDHSSISIMSTGVVSTESSDSPASDLGYKAAYESDSDINLARTVNHTLPSAVSSQAFATLMQGYANGARGLFHQQSIPITGKVDVVSMLQRSLGSASAPTMASIPSQHIAPQDTTEQLHGIVPAPVIGGGAAEDELAPTTNKASSKRANTGNTRKRGKSNNAELALPTTSVKEPVAQVQIKGEGEPQEEKRAQFLERNRVAACKSRQKKKEWVKSLESSADELNRRNSELQQIVHSQQEEIAYLRNMLTMHEGCECAEVQNARMKLPSQQTIALHQQQSPNVDASPVAPFSPPQSAVSITSTFADQLASATLHDGGTVDLSMGGDNAGATPSLIPFNMAQHNLSSHFDYFSDAVMNNGNSQPFSTPELAESLGFET